MNKRRMLRLQRKLRRRPKKLRRKARLRLKRRIELLTLEIRHLSWRLRCDNMYDPEPNLPGYDVPNGIQSWCDMIKLDYRFKYFGTISIALPRQVSSWIFMLKNHQLLSLQHQLDEAKRELDSPNFSVIEYR